MAAQTDSLRKFAILATKAKMHAKAEELWQRLVDANNEDGELAQAVGLRCHLFVLAVCWCLIARDCCYKWRAVESRLGGNVALAGSAL